MSRHHNQFHIQEDQLCYTATKRLMTRLFLIKGRKLRVAIIHCDGICNLNFLQKVDMFESKQKEGREEIVKKRKSLSQTCFFSNPST